MSKVTLKGTPLPTPTNETMEQEAFDTVMRVPGAFYFSRRDGYHFKFCCPCGCQTFQSLPINTPNGWQLTGTEDCPTLVPSIGTYPIHERPDDTEENGRFHWHGFMKAGVFDSVNK